MSETIDDLLCDVRIDCSEWNAADPVALADVCYAAVRDFEKLNRALLSVLFTDNSAMQDLNSQFRGKDKPTNVLSFPAGDTAGPEGAYLGDIALGFEICRHEAEAAGVSLRDHAAHLLVHGILHLIGYHHETDEDASLMEGKERSILEKMGIADPYESGGESEQ